MTGLLRVFRGLWTRPPLQKALVVQGALLKVAAGGEGAVSRAGDNGNAQVRVPLELRVGLRLLVCCLVVVGIHGLGPVVGDDADVSLLLKEDCSVLGCHGSALLSVV